MTPGTRARIFDARTHACRLVRTPAGPRAGWFGGAPLGAWHVPRSVDGLPSLVVVAVLEVGAIDEARTGERIWLAIDPREVGVCDARLERARPGDGSAEADPRTGPAVPFHLEPPAPDASWVPGSAELGGLGCKLGGRPGYLQQDLVDGADLASRGYELVAQVDCEDRHGLPPSVASLLCDGALYLFAKREGPGFDFEDLALRWQY